MLAIETTKKVNSEKKFNCLIFLNFCASIIAVTNIDSVKTLSNPLKEMYFLVATAYFTFFILSASCNEFLDYEKLIKSTVSVQRRVMFR